MMGRATLRETSYLLIGGAIALSFIALTAAISSTFVTRDDQIFTLLLLALVPMAVVGLLPGVRELQVAGVETLLGVDRAVVPEPMSWPHRWRTCLWTFLHQVVGFIAGSALLLAIALVVGAIVLATGNQPSILDTVITRPDSVGTWILFWVGVIGCVGVAVAVFLLGGAAATWAAPVLLGPTGADRLALAETRLHREQEYRRLSRDLHDGVGHALSAISLQAEAGRRHLRHDPDRAGAALAAISDLSGSAVAELDHALSVLRDGAVPRHPEPGLAQLDALLDSHRSLGITVIVEQQDIDDLPAVVSRTAYRVCTEGLANAAKHGTGPVTLAVAQAGGQLRIELRNAARRRPGAGAGRGLKGLRERIEVLGGELTAGPGVGGWVLVARLPLGERRG